MTVQQAPTAPATNEELLISEAIRQRRHQRKGRSLAGALALAVLFTVVGFVLTIHPGLIASNTAYSFSPDFLPKLMIIFGVVSFLLAACFVVGAVSGLRPRAAWGDSVPGDCPVCGRPALRAGEVTVWDGYTLKMAAEGTVTLCETPGCPHATAAVG